MCYTILEKGTDTKGNDTMKENIKELFRFIEAAPTAFHAADQMKKELKANGFKELTEGKEWKLESGKNYYVTRNHSSLIAFRIPEKNPLGYHIVAAHTDSPSFKIKEDPEMKVDKAYVKLDVEKYGGMIVSSWFDRPLSVAGRVFIEDHGIKEKLVHIDRDLLVIPSLAIHMDRKTNEGHSYQIQKELLPVFSERGEDTLKKLIAKQISVPEEKILSGELYLYVRQKGRVIGNHGEWILSPRLDDLQCVFAGLKGITMSEPEKYIAMTAFLDNEEVGSGTKQGAGSDFLPEVLARIGCAFHWKEEKRICMKNNSFLISADNAHALHPNYPEKADPKNQPELNGGIVIKYHGGQKYTTDAHSSALLKKWCKEYKIPYQNYHNHSDIAGGSTLGNILTAHLSVPSVDLGFPQLAMHAAVEMAGRKDVWHGIRLFKKFFSE